jgi:hypothetical protein
LMELATPAFIKAARPARSCRRRRIKSEVKQAFLKFRIPLYAAQISGRIAPKIRRDF